jgi:cell wall-associated NlpC family hydrolase
VTELKYHHLVGRKFTGIGRQDCFDLVTHFFWDNFQIRIRDYARPQNWKSDQNNLILKIYEREGFQKITEYKPKDIRPGDVLCVCIGESNPNHLAVYVGNGKIVHHIYGRLSQEEDLQGFWLNQTAFILRHPDVPDLRPIHSNTTLKDILDARNAPPTGRHEGTMRPNP